MKRFKLSFLDSLKNNMGVYIIKNNLNEKVYIGSSTNICKKYLEDTESLERGLHSSNLLQAFYNTNHDSIFDFSMLESVSNKINLKKREQYWLDFYKSTEPNFGFNVVSNDSDFTNSYKKCNSKDRINVSLPPIMVKRLKYLSDVRGISVSELIRRYTEICLKSDFKMYGLPDELSYRVNPKGEVQPEIVVDTTIELDNLL